MSLVSIIIPAHNSERTILECISSAVNQTYSKLEIIVVNDRSTDNTHSLLLQLDDPRIKFLTTSVGSASAARNFGLDFASGEYIQFLDADDVLELNKIQHQLQKLEMSSPKSIANCPWGHFSTSTSDSAVQRQKIDCDSIPIDWLIQSWNGGGMAQTACWLTPRRLINEAGKWNESLPKNPNDDGEFFCRVLLKADYVCFTPETRVFYRIPSDGSVSKVKSTQQARSLLDSYVNCEIQIRIAEDSPRTRAAAAQNYYRFIYSFGMTFPELATIARRHISILGNPNCTSVGSKKFRILTKAIGFDLAITIQQVIYRFSRRSTKVYSAF